MVIDGLEADAQKRKDVLQIVSHFQIITTKSGQILYDNAAYFTLLCKINHSLKTRAFKVRTGESVIAKLQAGKLGKSGCLVKVSCDQTALC